MWCGNKNGIVLRKQFWWQDYHYIHLKEKEYTKANEIEPVASGRWNPEKTKDEK